MQTVGDVILSELIVEGVGGSCFFDAHVLSIRKASGFTGLDLSLCTIAETKSLGGVDREVDEDEVVLIKLFACSESFRVLRFTGEVSVSDREFPSLESYQESKEKTAPLLEHNLLLTIKSLRSRGTTKSSQFGFGKGDGVELT